MKQTLTERFKMTNDESLAPNDSYSIIINNDYINDTNYYTEFLDVCSYLDVLTNIDEDELRHCVKMFEEFIKRTYALSPATEQVVYFWFEVKTLRDILTNYEAESDCDFMYIFREHLDTALDEIDADDLRDIIVDDASTQEIIYYSNAIEYLSENDPSLKGSISLAVTSGYELDNITSELLATLLCQSEYEEKALRDLSKIMKIINLINKG